MGATVGRIWTTCGFRYQPFDPARHNIGAWTAGFKRLVPDDASDEQGIRLFECRLPHQYADLLRQAQTESEEHASGWREAVKLFLSRVSGSENRLSKLRKLKSLTQNDGEQIRQFAIRVWDQLKRFQGKEPTDQEWRDRVSRRPRRYSRGTRENCLPDVRQSELLGSDQSCGIRGAPECGTPE